MFYLLEGELAVFCGPPTATAQAFCVAFFTDPSSTSTLVPQRTSRRCVRAIPAASGRTTHSSVEVAICAPWPAHCP